MLKRMHSVQLDRFGGDLLREAGHETETGGVELHDGR